MANGKVTLGDKWRPIGGSMTWRVVSVRDGRIGLSGPGPMRGMQFLDEAELREEWEREPDGALKEG